jgi:hypothetical protein
MARMSAKVIARIHTTSDGLADLSWEWILRIDGQVLRRLTAVGGRRERNPWMDVTQLSARDLQALQWDHQRARAALESLAGQCGHQASQARGQLHTELSVRAPGPDAGRIKHWGNPGRAHRVGTEWTAQPGDAPAMGNFGPRAAEVLLPHPRRDMSREPGRLWWTPWVSQASV